MEETRLVLLGPPACGKGTQGRLLAESFDLSYFSTGKQLRREVEAGTELGKEADTYLSRTEYVPDRLVMRLVAGWVRMVEGGWILDGFPRTLPQAVEWDAYPSEQIASMKALLIEVDRVELEERVSLRRECRHCSWSGTCRGEEACPSCGQSLGQRRDDAPEAFRKRMDVYEELTVPVVDYFASSDRLVRVSGIGSPEEVFTRVQRALQIHG